MRLMVIITKTIARAGVFTIPFAVKWKNTNTKARIIINSIKAENILLTDFLLMSMWNISAKNSNNLAHNTVSMNAIATPNVNKLAILLVANAGAVAPINPSIALIFACAGDTNFKTITEVIKRIIHPPNPHRIALKLPPGPFDQVIDSFLLNIVTPIINKIKLPIAN